VRWYRPEGKYSPEEIADFYVAMLLDGLATGGSTDQGVRREQE
jgi:hypothetical protein